MTDLDQRITSALRERAEGEIDTGRLLRDARTLGRRRQVRRRLTAGTALALVGVLGLAGAVRTDVGGLAGRMPWTATKPTAEAPVPPKADGAPGAAQRPELVGSDPLVLHLGLDTRRARYLGWAAYTANRTESIQYRVGGGRPVLVEVSPDRRAVSELLLNGLPGAEGAIPVTFDGKVREFRVGGGGAVRAWQPAPGLYARASMLGGDRSALTEAVEAIRWNEARRCDAPLRLGAVPSNAQVATCAVDADGFPGGLTVELTIVRAPTATMNVRLVHGAQIARDVTSGNRTVDGRPAHLSAEGHQLELLGIPKAHLTATFGWMWQNPPPAGQVDFTEAEAASVLAGTRVAPDLTDPETWD
ncbi:hypothetical protein O7600_12980 [Micromonospora sp. WMMA1998]|uniref:hypothetical protein n=1 Tax=Micromonospora sp. WMMA1998 TaxID=3015167 RepID=UPI00248B51B6|nr:hypothetical protein [Micromonospora sp. WMMA1998]WBC17674.1 hypothetical protein O7600_12980 [Micromonospora sp. WMMA1998]